MFTAVAVVLCLLVLSATAACGGGSSNQKSYDRALSEQEKCCNRLADSEDRQQCLDDIVRVDDPEVQATSENRATYSCIERHFVCDPDSGRATGPSAQAQLDCINEL